MKQLFKNASIYGIQLPVAGSLESITRFLDKTFVEYFFQPPLPHQLISLGFVSYGENEDGAPIMADLFPGGFAFKFRIDEKKIPAKVLDEAVKQKMDDLALPTFTKMQKAQLKAEAEMELAERAFATPKVLECFFVCRDDSTADGYLFVPTLSAKDSGRVTSAVVKALGKLKTSTINVHGLNQGLSARLHAHLRDEVPEDLAVAPGQGVFGNFDVSSSVWLKRPSGGDRLTFQVNDQTEVDQAIIDAIDNGYQVKALEMAYSGLAFRLRDDFKWAGIHSLLVEDGEPVEDPELQKKIEIASLATRMRLIRGAVDALCAVFGYDPHDPSHYIEKTDSGDDTQPDGHSGDPGDGSDEDALLFDAVELVCKNGRFSISMIQRHFNIGYNHAAHIVDALEREGVVTAADSHGQRTVIGGDEA